TTFLLLPAAALVAPPLIPVEAFGVRFLLPGKKENVVSVKVGCGEFDTVTVQRLEYHLRVVVVIKGDGDNYQVLQNGESWFAEVHLRSPRRPILIAESSSPSAMIVGG